MPSHRPSPRPAFSPLWADCPWPAALLLQDSLQGLPWLARVQRLADQSDQTLGVVLAPPLAGDLHFEHRRVGEQEQVVAAQRRDRAGDARIDAEGDHAASGRRI